jgi:hypothetical protein
LCNYALIKRNYTNIHGNNFTPSIPNEVSHAIWISSDVASCGFAFEITLKKAHPSPQRNTYPKSVSYEDSDSADV